MAYIAKTFSNSFSTISTSPAILVNMVGPYSVQLLTTGSGAVTTTMLVEVTNDTTGNSGWVTLATLSTSGTAPQVDSGAAVAAPWTYARFNCTAISGTNAAATVSLTF